MSKSYVACFLLLPLQNIVIAKVTSKQRRDAASKPTITVINGRRATTAFEVVFTMGNPTMCARSSWIPLAASSWASVPAACSWTARASAPAQAQEIAALARAVGCYVVDAPVSSGDVGARDDMLIGILQIRYPRIQVSG
jgi:3-hydroxyisobutyrate dehydrogenase-like beta-hydroxyacid dehydrogenase